MKNLIALSLVCAMGVVGPVYVQAEVEIDILVNGYFMDNYERNLQ